VRHLQWNAACNTQSMTLRLHHFAVLSTVPIALLIGCQKKDELPEHMQGSYRLTQLLGSDNKLTLTAKDIKVSECKVNCGDDIHLDSVDCQVGSARCTFKSKKCTGSLEMVRGEKTLTIHASPVDKEHDFATCNNISGTMKVEP
jgi:hypothetical protein